MCWITFSDLLLGYTTDTCNYNVMLCHLCLSGAEMLIELSEKNEISHEVSFISNNFHLLTDADLLIYKKLSKIMSLCFGISLALEPRSNFQGIYFKR